MLEHQVQRAERTPQRQAWASSSTASTTKRTRTPGGPWTTPVIPATSRSLDDSTRRIGVDHERHRAATAYLCHTSSTSSGPSTAIVRLIVAASGLVPCLDRSSHTDRARSPLW